MSEAKKTEADRIWDEIKDVSINVFGADGQAVNQYVKKLDLPGTSLYVKLTAGAVLPALETAIGRLFTVVLHDGYVMVTRKDLQTEEVKKALKAVK